MNEPLYRINRQSDGNLKFDPALPNDQIMTKMLNSKIIMAHPDAGNIMKKVIDMEWQYLERRIIKWFGDTEEARLLKNEIKSHIKAEKKWIAKGAKIEDVV